MMKNLILIFILTLSVNAFSEVVTIGNDNRKIEYDLNSGTACFVVNGQTIISNFHAEVRMSDIYTSKMYTERIILNRGIQQVVINTDERYPTMRQTFSIDAEDNIKVTVSVEDDEVLSSNYMSPLVVDDIGSVEVGSGDRVLIMPAINDNGSTWDFALSNETNKRRSYNAVVYYNSTTREGLVVGAVTHINWRTGIDVTGSNNKLDYLKVISGVKSERDVENHGSISGQSLTSSTVLIGFYKDVREGLKDYALENTKYQDKAPRSFLLTWDQQTVFSWKTWGQGTAKIDQTEAKIYTSLDFFANELIPLGFHNDAGYNGMMIAGKTSINGNNFTNYAAANNQIAGGYATPFQTTSDPDLSAPVKGAPEYTLREITIKDADGKPVIIKSQSNNSVKYGLDPTHPGTKKSIENSIKPKFDRGMKFLRLDFMFMGAIEGHYYDTTITTGIQAYNYGVDYINSITQGKMHINLAIAPYFPYHIGHSRRIAGDTGDEFEDMQYKLNCLAGGWWMGNGVLYDNLDPGDLIFNPTTDNKELSQAIVNASAITGYIQLSDDYSDEHMQNMAKKYLTNSSVLEVMRLGKSFMPVEMNTGTNAPTQFVHYTDNDTLFLAVFNHNASSSVSIPIVMNRFVNDINRKYHFVDLWANNKTSKSGHQTWVLNLPAKGSKLYKVYPSEESIKIPTDSLNIPFNVEFSLQSKANNLYVSVNNVDNQVYANQADAQDGTSTFRLRDAGEDCVYIESYDGTKFKFFTNPTDRTIESFNGDGGSTKWYMHLENPYEVSFSPKSLSDNYLRLDTKDNSLDVNGTSDDETIIFTFEYTDVQSAVERVYNEDNAIVVQSICKGGFITIWNNGNISGNRIDAELFNLDGTLCKSYQFQLNSSSNKVNVEGLKSGIYILYLKVDSNFLYSKIIIK